MLINAHKTLRRKIVYKWHPLFGQELCVHVGAGARKKGVLHCDISGKAEVAGLAIPIWMFDLSVCQRMRLRSRPFVDRTALDNLKRLLSDTIGFSNPQGATDDQSKNIKKIGAAGDALVVKKSTPLDSPAPRNKTGDDPVDCSDATRSKTSPPKQHKKGV